MQNDDEFDAGEAVDSPSLSQEMVEETRTIPKTMSLLGTAPIVCRKCDCVLFTKDLTNCPLCGASPVARAAIVHYAQPCGPDHHDSRFLRGRVTQESTGAFRIPCQPSATGKRPTHITPTLSSVTCSRCLHEMSAEMDSNGRLVKIWGE